MQPLPVSDFDFDLVRENERARRSWDSDALETGLALNEEGGVEPIGSEFGINGDVEKEVDGWFICFFSFPSPTNAPVNRLETSRIVADTLRVLSTRPPLIDRRETTVSERRADGEGDGEGEAA